MSSLRLLGALALLMAVAAAAGWSQVVNATLLGTVTDASGAVVPNAKVTVTETQTGINHTAQTNESGNYVVPYLSPGVYSVVVEANGFKKVTQKNISLQVDTTTRVDTQLQPGSLSESIEVTAPDGNGTP